MEKSFGIICEGPSDYRIMKKIIETYFKNEVLFTTCYQPKQSASGKSDFGGWPKVLEACQNDTLKNIFDFNNFAVIQIDTDYSQDKPFNITHINGKGKPKTDIQLYNDIVERLNSLIAHPEIQDKKHNIIFAICIHSVECWLLPLVYSDSKREHTNNCIEALNRAIKKKYKGIAILTEKNKNKDNGIKAYTTIMNPWKRKVDIINAAGNNTGFLKFINSLEKIQEREG